jgi:hypothetical protein
MPSEAVAAGAANRGRGGKMKMHRLLGVTLPADWPESDRLAE